MIKVIYDELKAKQLNPYFPGQHKGLVTTPYCVVRPRAQIPSTNSRMLGRTGIDIILFVPRNSFISLEPYANQIKDALKDLDFLRKTGFETEGIIDDSKEAYTNSIEYVLMKKLEG